MNQAQAGEIVALLTAVFHRDALEAESLVVFGRDVALLADVAVAREAVRDLSRAQDRFPTLREFRDAYHAVSRRTASERAETHGLPEGDDRETPEWVHVWWWARHQRTPRDRRPLPQQRVGGAEPPDELTLPEYEALRAEWEQADRPRLGSAGQLVGAAEPRHH